MYIYPSLNSLRFFGEHEKCVKSKAASSVRIIAGVSQDSANQAVDSVFTKQVLSIILSFYNYIWWKWADISHLIFIAIISR